MEVTLQHRKVGPDHKPFIIAEMSGNHNQSLDRALAIVDAAAAAGADAIKLQTYTADTMTIKGAYKIDDPGSLWYGKELHDLYKEAFTPWEWHAAIFERAKNLGMLAFSSPFDETAVDFLEKLGAPFYKIASFENTDWPLLKRVAQTGKPVIMSTGVSTLAELDESVALLRQHGCTQLVLLKCTSTYPASPENSNVLTIPHMSSLFRCPVGLSDHTMGIGAAVAAVALGARVIEKHFTLRRADGGVDSAFSLEPAELKSLVVECERAFLSMGKIQYGVQASELKSKNFKRSLYFAKSLQKGDTITADAIRIIRPGNGLPTKFLQQVIGRTVKSAVEPGTPVVWDLI